MRDPCSSNRDEWVENGAPVGMPTLHLPIAQPRISSTALLGFRNSRATAQHRAVPPHSSCRGPAPCRKFRTSVDISTNTSDRFHVRLSLLAP
jgi:hypothetical protein